MKKSSDMLNKRVVALCTIAFLFLSSAMNVFAAEDKNTNNILIEYYKNKANFNVSAYKEAYPDVVLAYGENASDDVYLSHYIYNGISEGRSDGTFDGIALILNNKSYFEEHGLDEDFPYFNVRRYKMKNKDLQKNFGDDLSLYLEHYLTFGILEGRDSCSQIDVVYFSKIHPDVRIDTDIDLSLLSTEEALKMFSINNNDEENIVEENVPYFDADVSNVNNAKSSKKKKEDRNPANYLDYLDLDDVPFYPVYIQYPENVGYLYKAN